MTTVATDLADLSATDLLDGYRRRRFDPVEVTQACLARIDRLEPRLNAMVRVDAAGALAQARESARRWAEGRPTGPLDGVPVTIKDLAPMRGVPTGYGSAAMPDEPAAEDAPAVARLREAGAVFLGKTTTPEFGHKGVTDSVATGITRNPWNPDLTPGGSSGGAAAAAAAGYAPLNHGSDGGGSLRIPAAFTGTVGVKPSLGRVPSWPEGAFASLSSQGPITRTVDDAVLMLDVLSQPDSRDPDAVPFTTALAGHLGMSIAGLRIGFAPTINAYPVPPAIAACVAQAARVFNDELRAPVEEVTLELRDYEITFNRIWTACAAWLVGGFTSEQRAKISDSLGKTVTVGQRITAAEYIGAEVRRAEIAIEIARLFDRFDLLLLPSVPTLPFAVGLTHPGEASGEPYRDWTPFTYPFNMARSPAASVPCGLVEGLPVGLQIVGRVWDESRVLRAAKAFEAARPWGRPALAATHKAA